MQLAAREAAPHGCMLKADCRSCYKFEPNAAQLFRTVWYGVLQLLVSKHCTGSKACAHGKMYAARERPSPGVISLSMSKALMQTCC